MNIILNGNTFNGNSAIIKNYCGKGPVYVEVDKISIDVTVKKDDTKEEK